MSWLLVEHKENFTLQCTVCWSKSIRGTTPKSRSQKHIKSLHSFQEDIHWL